MHSSFVLLGFLFSHASPLCVLPFSHLCFLYQVLFRAQAFLFLLACVSPTLACIPSATRFPSLAQLPSPWSGAFPLSFPHAYLLWCTPFLSLSCGLSFAHAFPPSHMLTLCCPLHTFCLLLALSCMLSLFAHFSIFSIPFHTLHTFPSFSHTLPHSFHLFRMSFLFFAWLSFLCVFPLALSWCMCPFTLQCMQAAFLILSSFPCLDCQCFSLSHALLSTPT